HRHLDAPPFPEHREPHGVADPVLVETRQQARHAIDRLPVHRHHDVARNHAAIASDGQATYSGRGGGPSLRGSQYGDTLDTELLGDGAIQVLVDLDAQRRADIFALGDELGNHARDGVDRYRKPDPGVRAGRAENHRVDADQTAGAVEQGTTRVPRVDRRIGLDEVLDQTAAVRGGQGSIERRHDARSERPVQAEGIADGKDLLT